MIINIVIVVFFVSLSCLNHRMRNRKMLVIIQNLVDKAPQLKSKSFVFRQQSDHKRIGLVFFLYLTWSTLIILSLIGRYIWMAIWDNKWINEIIQFGYWLKLSFFCWFGSECVEMFLLRLDMFCSWVSFLKKKKHPDKNE